ncbi:MAG: glycosyltransferase family 4 protein, partial [Alphaproteobacteria bacterium]|nr:glycosyltransferase family 4 protein [Alphaproteobacteria bacterium]
WIARVPAVINAMAGMGALFINNNLKMRILRKIIVTAFRFLLNRKNSRLIVQNEDDSSLFINKKIVNPERIVKIKGSGVDTVKYKPMIEPDGIVTASIVSRMLWDKGVGELVEAAEILKNRNVKICIVLIGDTDLANPRTIPIKTLKQWQKTIEWRGYTEDIADIWKNSHIAVLPSYREGMPKSLLEAAACGRPMITADVAGCRELVKHEENGLLVPVKDAESLANALERLANDVDLRKKLGKNARKSIETEYSEQIVAEQTASLYKQVCK